MRRTALVLALGFVALGLAPKAKASCAPLPPLRQAIAHAEVVFVGTVVALEHEGRTATFRVEDVWKGKLHETVIVHAGPGIDAIEAAERNGGGVASSVDRTYGTGTRYLVVSEGRSGKVLRDSICSSTQPYNDELVGFRPVTAHPPLPGGDASVGPTANDEAGTPTAWILLGGLASAGALLAVTLALSRLRVRRAGA
jgi:hypothetical protein